MAGQAQTSARAYYSIVFFAIVSILSLIAYSCGGGGASSPASPTLTAGHGAADTGSGDVKLMTGEPETPVLADGGPITSMAAPPCPPPAGASGNNTINSYYKPDNAFDGDMNTWWVGAVGAGAWDLYYGFPNVRAMDSLSITFYGATYVPSSMVLKVSTDGCTWTDLGPMSTGVKPTLAVGQNVRYLWIEMSGNPATNYPLIRDVDWVQPQDNVYAGGGPGANEAVYFPSNAFDGNLNTWWAGQVGAGAWNIYYMFSAPRMVQMVTAELFNLNYRPTNMILHISNDGQNWSSLGQMEPGGSPHQFVGQTTQYVWIEMTGNPPSNFPLIKDISFDIPAGASSGDSINTFYKPANAFDGVDTTWWTGAQGQTEWNLFYQYATDTTATSVSIAYYAATHAPATTEIFTSLDGDNWSAPLTFPAGANPTLALPSTPFRYVRFKMTGAPLVGYPLIKDITLSQQSGVWQEFTPGSASGTGVPGPAGDRLDPDVEVSATTCEEHIAWWEGPGSEIVHYYWDNASWTNMAGLSEYATATNSPPSMSILDDINGYHPPLQNFAVAYNSEIEAIIAGENHLTGMYNYYYAGGDTPSTYSTATLLSNPEIKGLRFIVWEEDGNTAFSYLDGFAIYWSWVEILSNGNGNASDPALALGRTPPNGDEIPFVAWSDTSSGNAEIYLRYCQPNYLTYLAWYEFPGGSASGGGISNNPGESTKPELIALSDTEVVAVWQQAGGVGGSTDIFAALCDTATGCTQLGNVSNDSVSSTDPTVTLDPNGKIVVAWIADNKDVYVKRYDNTLNVWEEMGAGSATAGGVSGTGTAQSPDFANDPAATHCGTYLAWSDGAAGSRNIYLKKFQP